MIKFGTGGWRAIIGEDFTKANIQILMTAIANKMKAEGSDRKGFVIGYDRRFLSKESTEWAACVLAAHDIHTYIIDRAAPTPLIMYTVKYYNLDYGMAVTASHNPALYNGVKVFINGGRDADEATTVDIERFISDVCPDDIKVANYEEAVANGQIEVIFPQNNYVDSIIRSINMDAIRSKNLRVVLDPMYGVSKTSLQTILLTARCDLDVIHDRHDTLFGGRLPAPTAETLNALRNFVVENGYDLGIGTDGDADRIGLIDDKGQFLHPNKILALLYYYLLKHKGWRGAVVRNIATTHILDRIADRYNQKCYEVPVGFKHISSKMLETNAIVGGESSGGLTVRGHIQGKDGIYAAAILVEMIAITGKRLSEISKDLDEEFGELYMTEFDCHFTLDRKAEIIDTLITQKSLPNFAYEVEKVSYSDGCKVYFKNGGWIIARFSGTEPLLRIFCEMPTEKEALATQETLVKFLGL